MLLCYRMKAYARSKAHSEAQSEVTNFFSNPFWEFEKNWNHWFCSLTPQQRIFVLGETETYYGPGSELPNI